MSEKRCTGCGSTGPFQKDASKKDGLSCKCKTCKKNYYDLNRETRIQSSKAWKELHPEQQRTTSESWRYRNSDRVLANQRCYVNFNRPELNSKARERCGKRKLFIDSLKIGRPCADCGTKSLPTFCMEFDHTKGGKRDSVSQMTSNSVESILIEVLKCELVCSNCHNIRTDLRRGRSSTPRRIRFRTGIDELKSNPCTDCGLTFPPAAMEFDHVRGGKLACVSNLLNWPDVLIEIAKCDLVCSNCHHIRTESRKNLARVA